MGLRLSLIIGVLVLAVVAVQSVRVEVVKAELATERAAHESTKLARDRAVDANYQITKQLDEYRRQVELLVAKTKDLQGKLVARSADELRARREAAERARRGDPGPERFNELMRELGKHVY